MLKKTCAERKVIDLSRTNSAFSGLTPKDHCSRSTMKNYDGSNQIRLHCVRVTGNRDRFKKRKYSHSEGLREEHGPTARYVNKLAARCEHNYLNAKLESIKEYLRRASRDRPDPVRKRRTTLKIRCRTHKEDARQATSSEVRSRL